MSDSTAAREHRVVGASAKDLSPDEIDRIVAILDRMLDIAVSLNWRVDRKEFFALEEQLADITGLPSRRRAGTTNA
jgi:hypothetical protein